MCETHDKKDNQSVPPGEPEVQAEAALDPAESRDTPVEVLQGEEELASRVAELTAQLELSQALSRETLEKLKNEHDLRLRAAADLENLRKRAAKEREDVKKFGNEKLLLDFLPVLDDLDRAIAAAPPGDSMTTGVQIVRSAFEKALAKHGIIGFTALGTQFDPARHEALVQIPSEAEPGTVVMEHARGFLLNERLIRPAMVGVAAALPSVKSDEKDAGMSAPPGNGEVKDG